jgi:hypothetical protein
MERDVDVFEMPVADVIWPADELLLSRRAEHLERARNAELVHRGLDGEPRAYRDRRVNIVAFAVSGRARYDLLALGDARDLRVVGVAVVFTVECHDTVAAPSARHEPGGKPGQITVDLEATSLERPNKEFAGPKLLHPQFAVMKDHVAQPGDRGGIHVHKTCCKFSGGLGTRHTSDRPP